MKSQIQSPKLQSYQVTSEILYRIISDSIQIPPTFSETTQATLLSLERESYK